jgi:hypothetical protein
MPEYRYRLRIKEHGPFVFHAYLPSRDLSKRNGTGRSTEARGSLIAGDFRSGPDFKLTPRGLVPGRLSNHPSHATARGGKGLADARSSRPVRYFGTKPGSPPGVPGGGITGVFPHRGAAQISRDRRRRAGKSRL